MNNDDVDDDDVFKPISSQESVQHSTF